MRSAAVPSQISDSNNMELESRSLSAPRDSSKSPRRALVQPSSAHVDIAKSNQTEVSYDDYGRIRRRKRSPDLSYESTTRKKTNIALGSSNTIVVCNLPLDTDTQQISEFVTRTLEELHGQKFSVLKCSIKRNEKFGRLQAFVQFATEQQFDLALSLNGIEYSRRPLYAHVFNSKAAVSIFKTKQVLCMGFLCGSCTRTDCLNAHGVEDLMLYDDTVLNKSRSVYIKNLPSQFPHVFNTIKMRLTEHFPSVFFTAFHERKNRGDAMFEVANVQHAIKAREILNGIKIGTNWIEVQPWDPEYQALFVNNLHNRVEKNYFSQTAERVWVPITPLTKKDRHPPSSSFDTEQSHSRDIRRMEDKVDDLRHENSDLQRDYDDVRWKYEELRQKYYDSKSSNHDYRRGGRDNHYERDDSRPIHEQSKDKTFDLQWQLDRIKYEKEVLEKESGMLKQRLERLEHLEDLQKMVPKVENIAGDLQSRLDQALLKNEELTSTLERTLRQVQDLESEKSSFDMTLSNLQMENESLQEEMDQMKLNHAMELGLAQA